ncbi:baseplate J/gp47 family protein [Sphingomonas psychrotolerans]|uniref:Baseplate J/gp47 family protein n=1 Tax=Sphingomonas psychrotolerans TaxID=1327635 RepID=A0ABU3N109_9SPHN|nr:baseplate J/gp47 family protein [Sphingomonas psychrotolerans]MDT8758234.1 baseplate J/gp47 family protein [Sphingomonas psychrotolerans]
MVGSIASSPAIDLSGLPAPAVIDQPDFETRLAAKIASLIAAYPAFDALVESDPAIKLLQADSYDETVLAQAFADAARGLLLAYAAGSQLDHLGALFGVGRLVVTPPDPATGAPAVFETDTALRQRIQVAPHSFSVAGPELAYVSHARAAHGDVADATAVSPAPGQVVVTVMSASGNGIPAAPVVQAVRDRLTGPVRPMTDEVIVQPASLVEFAITARLYVFAGPDQNLILQTALASLNSHLASARRLARDIPRSALIAALHVANVVRVDLIDPVADVVISPAQLGRVTAIDVQVAGTEL